MLVAVHSFDDDAESVLSEMGLSGEVMYEVCRRGLAYYHTATPFHPSNAAGSFMHHELVRATRELLVPSGWDYVEQSLSLTFNRELSIAIAVSSGTSQVGDRDRHPSFKYPKGPTTQAAVVSNAIQLGLFDNVSDFQELSSSPIPKSINLDAFQTWWLLHHVDHRKEEMRAELSLPVVIRADGDINEWRIRIILEPISFDSAAHGKGAQSFDESRNGPDFNVEVRKKA